MIWQTISEKKMTEGKLPGWINGRRAGLVFQRSMRSILAIELINNKFHGLSPSGGFTSLLFDQGVP